MLFYLFNHYRVDALHISSVLLALAVWRWGGAPERWLIVLFIATMVLPPRLFTFFGLGSISFGPYAWVWINIDFFAAAAFVAIALHANRNYPLWIAGFQLVAMSAHVVKEMVDSVSPIAYLILAAGPSYCQFALILAGLVRHVIRERQFGPYREWRVALPGIG
jgi:hypothetical protein